MKKLFYILYIFFISSSAWAMTPKHQPTLNTFRSFSTIAPLSTVSQAAHKLLGVNPTLLESNIHKTSAKNNYVKEKFLRSNQTIHLHNIQPDTVRIAQKTLTDHQISSDQIDTRFTERGCYDLVGSLFLDAMVHTTNEESRKSYRETYYQQNKDFLTEKNPHLTEIINSVAEKVEVPITPEQVFFSKKNKNATIIGDFIVVQHPTTQSEVPLFSFIVGHELAHIKHKDYLRTRISKLLLKLELISEKQFFEWQRNKEKNADLHSVEKLKCAHAILPSLTRECDTRCVNPDKYDHHPTDLQQIRYIIDMAEKEKN